MTKNQIVNEIVKLRAELARGDGMPPLDISVLSLPKSTSDRSLFKVASLSLGARTQALQWEARLRELQKAIEKL